MSVEGFPGLVRELYTVVGKLESRFPGRKFTPDGHLVGSLGEVIAAERYRASASMKRGPKTTCPIGKIYIGKDSIGYARHVSSPDIAVVNAGFLSLPDQDRLDYTIRKQMLGESESAMGPELLAKEVERIREHRSNESSIGCKRWPNFLR